MLKNLALSLVGAVAIVTFCAAPVAIAQTVAAAAKLEDQSRPARPPPDSASPAAKHRRR